MSHHPVLQRGPGWLTLAGFGAALVVLGLLFRRPDLVALAVPPLLLIATTRRTAAAPVDVALDEATAEPGLLTVPVQLGDTPGLTLLTIEAPGHRWQGHLVAGEHAGELRLTPPASGEGLVARVRHRGVAADTTAESAYSEPDEISTFVLPRDVAAALLVAPAPPRLARNPGSHRSRLAGPGSDPKDIRAFQPSDSLRQIDWRASARRPRDDELMVRERFAETQGTVRVMVDAGADLPWSPLSWFRTGVRRVEESSMFTELRLAALAVARAHLATGDRVGLSDLSGLKPPVRAATGMRQLDRLRAYLGHLRPLRTTLLPRHVVPPESGALVYVISGFLEPYAADRCRALRRIGYRVVAIDIGHRLERLRPQLRTHGRLHNRWINRALALMDPQRLTPGEANSARTILAARQAYLADLHQAHVPVLTWSDANQLGADLALLDRDWRARRRR